MEGSKMREKLKEILDKHQSKLYVASSDLDDMIKRNNKTISTIQSQTVEMVLSEIEGIYSDFARDLAKTTKPFLAIGKTIHYENATDKLIKEYNTKLNQIREQIK